MKEERKVKMKKSLLLALLFLIALDPADLLAQDSQMVLDQEVLAEGIEVLDAFLEKLKAIQSNEDGEYILEIHEDEMEHNIILEAAFSALVASEIDRTGVTPPSAYRLNNRFYYRNRTYKEWFDAFAEDHKLKIKTKLRWHTSKGYRMKVTLNFDESFVDVTDQIDGTVQRRTFSGILDGDLYQGAVGGLHRPDSPATKELQSLMRKFQSDPKFHTLIDISRPRMALKRSSQLVVKTFKWLVIGAIGVGTLYWLADSYGVFDHIMSYEYNLSPDFFQGLIAIVRGLRDEWSFTNENTNDSFAFEEEKRS